MASLGVLAFTLGARYRVSFFIGPPHSEVFTTVSFAGLPYLSYNPRDISYNT
jgi:hypothetical protein